MQNSHIAKPIFFNNFKVGPHKFATILFDTSDNGQNFEVSVCVKPQNNDGLGRCSSNVRVRHNLSFGKVSFLAGFVAFAGAVSHTFASSGEKLSDASLCSPCAGTAANEALGRKFGRVNKAICEGYEEIKPQNELTSTQLNSCRWAERSLRSKSAVWRTIPNAS